MTRFYGSYVWEFDNTIFYSSIDEDPGSGSKQYILNVNNNTWIQQTWNDNITFTKHDVWYNKKDTYIASPYGHYKVLK